MDSALSVSTEDNSIRLRRKNDDRRTRQIHGLNRTLVHNLILGVTDGFEKKITIVGVGYRAKVDANILKLSVGFSHTVEVEIPDGISVSVLQNVNLSISGIDKSLVGNFAAE